MSLTFRANCTRAIVHLQYRYRPVLCRMSRLCYPASSPSFSMSPVASSRPASGLYARIPALASLRTYSAVDARADFLAGLSVAAVAVPQAMAYAMIAGLPAQYGLYTAIVMTVVGALLDSSRQLINGPTNAISIALLSALAVVPESERVSAAITL